VSTEIIIFLSQQIDQIKQIWILQRYAPYSAYRRMADSGQRAIFDFVVDGGRENSPPESPSFLREGETGGEFHGG